MDILVVCEDALKEGMLKSLEKTYKNRYKVVGCEGDVIDAAVMTGLEVYDIESDYRVIVSVSQSVDHLDAAVLMPTGVGNYDAMNGYYSISGSDDYVVLSGLGDVPDVVSKVVKEYGSNIIFDKIAYGVSSVAADLDIINFAFVVDKDTDNFKGIVRILENLDIDG